MKNTDMLETTLCYIEKDNKYLMLHRIKKENDINKDKWIGIGGKLECGETPLACVIRETLEETGLILINPCLRGIVNFHSSIYPSEKMYLFTCTDFNGTIKECDEGILEWVDKDKITTLPLWEGDKIFLKALNNGEKDFEITLNYDKDKLVSHKKEWLK